MKREAAAYFQPLQITKQQASDIPELCCVIQPNSMETWKNAVECNARAQSGDYTLPDIKDGKCKDSSRTFSVTRGEKGLTFTISQPISPKSDTVGEHLIPKSELIQATTPNAEVQSYNGPKSFQLTQTS
ncbi:unnamed protein product [Fusarium langsethiae]|nr:unnamed protein product [Fusarium langsethiae]